ncbi:MAG: glycosyltransferase [Elusimicrobia bacterium]|nr:glycosyltransferase [Elusimicrobiota bacterium]
MPRLEEYRQIVGADTIEELRLLAGYLKGRTMLHVNSTAVGGGVAEILNRLMPLFSELEIAARWELIKGGEAFYAVTKKFHNALHGDRQEIAPKDYQVYEDVLDQNLSQMNCEADLVFIHDLQPAALVKKRKGLKNHWIWRCHIDLSQPDSQVWEFLKPYVEAYDACVFHAPSFAQKLTIPQIMIAPSIDPVSDKNRELEPHEVEAILERLKIPTDKPLVTQISRFDYLKDPLGVIEAFQKVNPYVDARLLLVGGMADDDPEGAQVLAQVQEKAKNNPDVIVLCLSPTSHIEINAIQRASAVILQKSLREGFALTVTEALWKAKPVIASAVGGIPLQVVHKYSGLLVHSIEGTAYAIKQLLSEPAYAKKLGQNGREHVRQNFLLTRHLRDYLLLSLFILNRQSDFIHLSLPDGTLKSQTSTIINP